MKKNNIGIRLRQIQHFHELHRRMKSISNKVYKIASERKDDIELYKLSLDMTYLINAHTKAQMEICEKRLENLK